MRYNSTHKFCRGQVWFLPSCEPGDEDYQKLKLYLVVSSEASNRRGRTVTVVPVTTRPEKQQVYPFDVLVIAYNNEYIIHCDTIYTTTSSSFITGSYEFSLSQESMDKVTERLALHLDVTNYIPGYDAMLRIVKILADQYTESIQNKIAITNEQANKLCETALESISSAVNAKIDADLKSRPEVKPTSVVAPQKEVKPDILENKPRKKAASPNITTKNAEVKPRVSETPQYTVTNMVLETVDVKHKPKQSWNEELKLEFLIDCDQTNIDQLAYMYSVKRECIPIYKSRFLKQLGLDTVK